jgi:hypothetical protein
MDGKTKSEAALYQLDLGMDTPVLEPNLHVELCY